MWWRSIRAWHGMVWHGKEPYGTAWHGKARHGMAWHGEMCRGVVCRGMAWRGMVRHIDHLEDGVEETPEIERLSITGIDAPALIDQRNQFAVESTVI